MKDDLQEHVLVKGKFFCSIHKPFQDERTISNAGKRARSDGEIVARKIDLGKSDLL